MRVKNAGNLHAKANVQIALFTSLQITANVLVHCVVSISHVIRYVSISKLKHTVSYPNRKSLLLVGAVDVYTQLSVRSIQFEPNKVF